MVYVKIVIASLIWASIFYYGGSNWFEKKREDICTSEVEKSEPDLNVVKENCLQTADLYVKKEEYGSASWFYLLGGAVDKNLNEIESNITDDFYMNIGHSYLLKGDYEKAREIYAKYPWSDGEEFQYADDTIQPDFEILPKLYKDKKENIAKGLAMWNEIYEPIGKIVDESNAYSVAVDEENTTAQIDHLKKYLEYAEPFKDKESIEYVFYQETLEELTSAKSKNEQSIESCKELLRKNNQTL